jgi:hypothetical protein
MRSVSEYLERATEFEALAAAASVDELKKRHQCLLSAARKERERLIGRGEIEGEPPIERLSSS